MLYGNPEVIQSKLTESTSKESTNTAPALPIVWTTVDEVAVTPHTMQKVPP